MMIKKILPFLFAATAASVPTAEAVEEYVGEPTKKLAQQAARCAGVMAFSSVVLNDTTTSASRIFIGFSTKALGESVTKELGFEKIDSYKGQKNLQGKLAGDLENCQKVLTAVDYNEQAQRIAECAGVALTIGQKETGEILGVASSVMLEDVKHAAAIAAKWNASLRQGSDEARKAAHACKPVFDIITKEKEKRESGVSTPKMRLEINI